LGFWCNALMMPVTPAQLVAMEHAQIGASLSASKSTHRPGT
jgi:hypothetical protein